MDQKQLFKYIREYALFKQFVMSDAFKAIEKGSKAYKSAQLIKEYVTFFEDLQITKSAKFKAFFAEKKKTYADKTKVKEPDPSLNDAGEYVNYLERVFTFTPSEKNVELLIEKLDPHEKTIKGKYRLLGLENKENLPVMICRNLGQVAEIYALIDELGKSKQKSEHYLDRAKTAEKLVNVYRGIKVDFADVTSKNKDLLINELKALIDDMLKPINEFIKTTNDNFDKLGKRIDDVEVNISKKIDDSKDSIIKSIGESEDRIITAIGSKGSGLSGGKVAAIVIASVIGTGVLAGGLGAIINENVSAKPAENFRNEQTTLLSSLYTYLSDGSFSEADLTSYNAEIAAFREKYAGNKKYSTQAETIANQYETLANDIFANQDEYFYNADYKILIEAIGDASSDKRLSAAEKTQLKSDLEAFKTKYAETAYKTQSESIYDYLNKIVDALDAGNEYANYVSAYNILVGEFKNSLLPESEGGRGLTAAEVEALKTKIETFKTTYANTDYEETSIESANHLTSMVENMSSNSSSEANKQAYIEDCEALVSSVKNTLGEDNKIDATEKAAIDKLIAEFKAKYKDSSFKSSSEGFANDLKAFVDSLYSDINTLRNDLTEAKTSVSSLKATVETLNTKYANNEITEQEYITQVGDALTSSGVTNSIPAIVEKLNQKIKAGEDVAEEMKEATTLIYEIAEMFTGEEPASLEEAMAIVYEGLGLTPTTPSNDSIKNPGKQPGNN